MDEERVGSPLLRADTRPSLPRRLTPAASSRKMSRSRLLSLAGALAAIVFILSVSHWHYKGGVSSVASFLSNVDRPAGYPQEPLVEVTEFEQELRAFAWHKPDPDDSLVKQLESLSENEQRTREWLKDSRPAWERGVGVGLARSDPPEPIREAAPVSRPRNDFPRANEGPGFFEGGDPDKFASLVREWQLGRKEPVCQSPPWQADYVDFHRKTMSRELPPRFLEFVCEEGPRGCGGIADRILGMTTTFLYALLTKRAYSAYWEHPFPVDLIFDAVSFDWSQPFNMSDTGTPNPIFNENNVTFLANSAYVDSYNVFPPTLDNFFQNDFFNAWKRDRPEWIQLSVNRGIVLRSFMYDNVRPELFKLGLTMENIWACTFDFVFRPKFPVLQYVAEYSSFFALPRIFSIGLQIRTGDQSMWGPESDAINTVERHKMYFTCAEQVAEAYARPDQKVIYYIISDSHHLKEDALAKYLDRVVVTSMPSTHVDAGHAAKANYHDAEGTMNTIAESWIYGHTDFKILTMTSGFGNVPTWRTGKQGRVIQLYNQHLYDYGPRPVPHCGVDTSIMMFSDLAAQWSLG